MLKPKFLAIVSGFAIAGGAVAVGVAVTQPRAASVSRSTPIPLTSPLRSPGPDYFWEPIPLTGGRGEWRKRPAGWQDPIYPPIGLDPSNTW